MSHRVFFPQTVIDRWAVAGKADFIDGHLVLSPSGRRFVVEEGVHVVAEVTGGRDDHHLVGRVKPRAFFAGLGAEILEHSMLLGDNAYDVQPGWVGVGSCSFERFRSLGESSAPSGPNGESLAAGNMHGMHPRSDEELLAAMLDDDDRGSQ